MDGIYLLTDPTGPVQVGNVARPKSRKAVVEAIASDPRGVVVEHTSLFRDGPPLTRVSDLPLPAEVQFVGPNPHSDRRFYGTLTIDAQGVVKVNGRKIGTLPVSTPTPLFEVVGAIPGARTPVGPDATVEDIAEAILGGRF